MNPLDARRRLLGRNVYKKTVEGNPAIAQGSLARRYPGITMQGWTEQNGTPTPEAPVPIVSAGTQNQETEKWDYEVKLTGANLFDLRSDNLSLFSITGDKQDITGDKQDINSGVRLTYENVRDCVFVADFAFEAGKTYFVSFDINVVSDILDGSAVSVYEPIVVTSNDAPSWWNRDVFRIVYKIGTTHYEGMFTPEKECTMYISGNNVIDNVTGYTEITNFILTEVENAEYEPYRLPQTVTLTADRPLTKWDRLEKRNGQWGWVYKSAEKVLDGSELWYATSVTECFRHPISGTILYQVLCDSLINWKRSINAIEYNHVCMLQNALYFRISGVTDLNGFKSFLQERSITIWYETTTETFVPLTASEQEQMNALHTFRPTTVLSNDCGCNMTLTYKTKKSLEVAT